MLPHNFGYHPWCWASRISSRPLLQKINKIIVAHQVYPPKSCFEISFLFYRNRNMHSLTPSRVSAGGDKRGKLLGESFKIPNFNPNQSLFELHTTLFSCCFTALRFDKIWKTEKYLGLTGCRLPLMHRVHSVMFSTFLGWTFRKMAKRRVIQGYFREGINAFINWLACKKI